MRILTIILLVFVQFSWAQVTVFPGVVAPVATVQECTPSDDFPASSLSANWTVAAGTWTTLGDSLRLVTENTDCAAWWNACNLNADQWAQCTVKDMTAISNDAEPGLALRANGTGGTADYYAIYVNSDGIRVFRIVNMGFSADLLGYSGAINKGDVIKASVSGTGATVTIKVYQNSVQRGSDILDTDATRLLSGQPGFCGFAFTGRIASIDTWSAGNL